MSNMKEGFADGASGKEPNCQCRRGKRHGFNPWVGNIPFRRAWKPTLVFLPGESQVTEKPGRVTKGQHDWSDLAQYEGKEEMFLLPFPHTPFCYVKKHTTLNNFIQTLWRKSDAIFFICHSPKAITFLSFYFTFIGWVYNLG